MEAERGQKDELKGLGSWVVGCHETEETDRPVLRRNE